MIEQPESCELDIVPPIDAISITLKVSPPDLELAVTTAGLSLCPAIMRAIVAAMVVDTNWRDAQH